MIFNAFRLYDTHGLPLSVTLWAAREHGIPVSLPAFYRDALRAGWKSSKTRSLVEEVLADAGEPRAYIDAALTYLDTVESDTAVPGEEPHP